MPRRLRPFATSMTKAVIGRPPGSTFSGRRPLFLIAMAGVLCLAAWLRWSYITQVQPFPDEFVTLLAVQMILQKGLPLLPSGLFYEHGLLFSYAGAAAGGLFGFSREVVRATSLCFGLLTIWLTWRMGRRWFSPGVGLLAATALAVAPSAILWGGRARMYTFLQVWVLLTVYLALKGATDGRPRWRWLALGCYLGATLTQFVSITLLPPLILGMILVGWLQARRTGNKPWFAARRVWLEAGGWIAVVVIALLVKRLGQPRSIAPLEATGGGVLTGIGQVIAIYGSLSPNLVESWQAVAPFFTAHPSIWLSMLALVATVWAIVRLARNRVTLRDLAALFLAWVLGTTALEMILLVAPERRDEKYLFMLLPVLCLLAADGITRLAATVHHAASSTGDIGTQEGKHENETAVVDDEPAPATALGGVKGFLAPLSTLVACSIIVIASWPINSAVLARTGPDYDTAFDYVRDHWTDGDAVMTGTPAAAGVYLDRNDYYAMQDPGYAYRILQKDGQQVDRWMGSPWLSTDEQIHAALTGRQRMWLVMERWGLTHEYFIPLTMQRMLAATEFVREDNGIIVLRSQAGAPLIPEDPPHAMSVNFDDQIRLWGYQITPVENQPADSGQRQLAIVLYWQALSQLPHDYSVFVHLRDAQGRTAAQSDHLPLAPVYPPTLWPAGQMIRERSILTIPANLSPGAYDLWVGLYRLDTLERLPIVDDRSGENAVWLAQEIIH